MNIIRYPERSEWQKIVERPHLDVSQLNETVASVLADVKQRGDEAGLTDRLSPQILRNSFAAHMVQNGADIKSLQDILGHEDITATRIYLSLTKNRIIDVYDKAFPWA